ncbi:MAG: glycerol-3-phosphate dehydrogenase [Pseudomonadota bacterium]
MLDVMVIGGGINGVGIAADLAGRGLRVCLAEKKDFASATSSWSSKLIHGGLRYLEHYEFRLVREALAEREVLLHNAPHLIKPMRFVLPHQRHLRPIWLIAMGLFLYDRIGGSSVLPKTRYRKFNENSPLHPTIQRGFEYSDCTVDDARLVIANAILAREKGAEIINYTSCTRAKREGDHWLVELETAAGQKLIRRAKALVNATGPWAQTFIESKLQQKSPRRVRLIKGSHMIVPRLYRESHAYILQNEDKRIVFVIPYQDHFSLIGTTDTEYQGDPSQASMDVVERDYLLDIIRRHFKTTITNEQIVHHFSGVRPLCDDESADPSAITRDYTLEVEDKDGKLPLLSIFGGKITTYRKLSEAACLKLKPYFPNMGKSWTRKQFLPGGDIHPTDLHTQLAQTHAWIPDGLRKRWIDSYGSLCLQWLKNCNSIEDLGPILCTNLYESELRYLMHNEWAITAEDVLWRRSKLGLITPPGEQLRVEAAMTQMGITGAYMPSSK